jgi:diguanylate cyclase (GGDEF)-like protein
LEIIRLDPELETKYRRYYLATDQKRLYLGVILWTISFIGFAYSDFLLYGLRDTFWALLAVRVTYVLFGIATVAVLRNVKLNLTTFDWLVLVWVLVTVMMDVFVGLLRPRDDISVMIDDLLGVFSFYVFVSNRMSLRVLPALLISLANMLMALFYKEGLTGQLVLSFAFSFTITNLVGILFSRHYFDMRRTEFLARREETRVQAELQKLASTDPLTGVYNRRRLIELAGDALYRYRRYGRPFSILVMDLDGFKNVNDTFGHQQGDAVLIEFSRGVLAEKRVTDTLGRMGGDEFALVLPETSPDEARVLAERILQQCGEIHLVNETDSVRVTTSIGISQALPGDTGLDPLFARADTALYRAKQFGRNRYVVV